MNSNFTLKEKCFSKISQVTSKYKIITNRVSKFSDKVDLSNVYEYIKETRKILKLDKKLKGNYSK